jgi:hypothetical protein
MIGWLNGGRGDTARLRALEARLEQERTEAEKIRTALLAQLTTESQQLHDLCRTVTALSAKIANLEAAVDQKIKEIFENWVKEEQAQLAKMRSALLRVESELEVCVEDSRKTGLALLERLENHQRGSTSAPAVSTPTNPNDLVRDAATDDIGR